MITVKELEHARLILLKWKHSVQYEKSSPFDVATDEVISMIYDEIAAAKAHNQRSK